jgi:aryl-alcohol dehydrogenase-like predicted oxidoreductase
MVRRPLGKTALQIHPLVLGGNVFGWTADERSSHSILDAYVAGGGNFIDTANVYSVWVPGHRGGESESVIGSWLARRGRRDDVLIATKVGWEMGPGQKGLSAPYILQSVEESLRRLRTDYIDVYFSHRDDTSLGVEEPLRAYEQLLASGKIRVIGASNFTTPRLRESLAVAGLPHYGVLQPQYNLVERDDFEGELQALCIEQGLGVVCYFALASGFLTGKYRSRTDLSRSPRGQGIGRYLAGRGPAVLRALDEVAAAQGARPSQIALAWLMAQPGVTAPIASATSVAQVEELLAATRVTLTPQQLALLSGAGR